MFLSGASSRKSDKKGEKKRAATLDAFVIKRPKTPNVTTTGAECERIY